MKKLLLHIVLFSYAIVLFKPAFPYMEDFIGHVLFYKQHMATVHFENGQYHVHAEVNKEIKNQSPARNTDQQKKAFSQNEFFAVKNLYTAIPFSAKIKEQFYDRASLIIDSDLQAEYRPPKS